MRALCCAGCGLATERRLFGSVLGRYAGLDACTQPRLPVLRVSSHKPHPLTSLDLPSTLPPAPYPQTVANNFSGTAWAFNKLLNVVNAAHAVLGAAPLKAISGALNRLSGHMVPEWNPYMPKVRGCTFICMEAPDHGRAACQPAVVCSSKCLTEALQAEQLASHAPVHQCQPHHTSSTTPLAYLNRPAPLHSSP